jgi:hypothetical protein
MAESDPFDLLSDSILIVFRIRVWVGIVIEERFASAERGFRWIVPSRI